VLPAIHKPAEADKLQGFRRSWVNDMLMVDDLSKVAEDLKPLLLTVRHGFGIQIYAEGGGRYAGDWHNNQITGDGHLVYRDGSEYRGSFINGVRNGHGLFFWPKQSESGETGHIYIGQWRDGMLNGAGRF
jgi:hypothetical protein